MSTSPFDRRQQHLTVLVADDRPQDLNLVTTLFEQRGHRVLAAESGAEALLLMDSERPDAVVAATGMAGLDGYQLCRILKDDPGTRPIPVLLLTGEEKELDGFWARACGAERILAKDPERFLAVDVVVDLANRPGTMPSRSEGAAQVPPRRPRPDPRSQPLARALETRLLESGLRDVLRQRSARRQAPAELVLGVVELLHELAGAGAIHVAIQRERVPLALGIHGPKVGPEQRAALEDSARQALDWPQGRTTIWKEAPSAGGASPEQPELFSLPIGAAASSIIGCMTLWVGREAFLARERLFEIACEELDQLLERVERRLGSNRDLARRRHAEEELVEATQRLQLATRSAGMGSFEWDIPRDIRHFDDTVHRLIGTDPERFTGATRDFYQAIHPDDRDFVRASLIGAMENGEYETEYRAVWADGSIHHIAARGRLLLDAHGRPARLNGVLWDVTARKQAEADLQREQIFTRALLDHLMEGVVACDAKGDLVLFNRTLREWQGLDPLRLPQDEWAEQYDLFEADGTTPLATQAIPLVRAYNGEIIRGCELAICAVGRPPRVVLANGAPMFDRDNQLLGAVVVMHDVTRQRRMEAARMESEARFRELFETSKDGLAVVDLAGLYLDCNQAFLDLLGLGDKGDLLGRPFQEFTPAEFVALEIGLVRQFGDLPVGASREFEKEYLRPSGARIPVEARIWISRDPAGQPAGIWVIARDITERRLAQKQLQELNEGLEDRIRRRTALLEEANAELDAFSYSVSHDLRAPLRGIDGFSHALLEEFGDQLDDQAKHYLTRVRAGTQRMGQLIEGLLRLARVSRTALNRQRLDLSAMALALLEDLRLTDAARPVEFEVEPGLTACGDLILVRSVLENLLGNALKYTAKVPVARIAFYQELQVDGTVAFCVRDNGAGFDMAYAGKLFSPFQRLHSAEEFEGSGIGLSMVQRIVHRHGGHVRVQAEPGMGATFAFTLPGGTDPEPA